jgi:hypothetical protein
MIYHSAVTTGFITMNKQEFNLKLQRKSKTQISFLNIRKGMCITASHWGETVKPKKVTFIDSDRMVLNNTLTYFSYNTLKWYVHYEP